MRSGGSARWLTNAPPGIQYVETSIARRLRNELGVRNIEPTAGGDGVLWRAPRWAWIALHAGEPFWLENPTPWERAARASIAEMPPRLFMLLERDPEAQSALSSIDDLVGTLHSDDDTVRRERAIGAFLLGFFRRAVRR